VPLNSGSADFDAVFAALAQLNYRGNFILQTARAADGNHSEVLRSYRDMTAAVDASIRIAVADR
jgi:L-ribulose-5-phosphate 3-epimerase